MSLRCSSVQVASRDSTEYMHEYLRKMLDITKQGSTIRELACKLLEPLTCSKTARFMDVNLTTVNCMRVPLSITTGVTNLHELVWHVATTECLCQTRTLWDM